MMMMTMMMMSACLPCSRPERPLSDSVVPSHLMIDPTWIGKCGAEIRGADLVTELTNLIRTAPYEQLSAYASNPLQLLEESSSSSSSSPPTPDVLLSPRSRARATMTHPPSRLSGPSRMARQYKPSPLGKGLADRDEASWGKSTDAIVLVIGGEWECAYE